MIDEPDVIARKIRKAKTDPHPLPDNLDDLDGRPEAANLMGIYAALDDCSIADVCLRFGGGQFSMFKQDLADLAVAHFTPIQQEMCRIMAEPEYVDGILRDGIERADAISSPILREIQDVVGFLRP
jgi:tryptophanyl-tRNA synthetase